MWIKNTGKKEEFWGVHMFVFELLFCISTTICFVLLSILFFLREDKYSDLIHLIPSSFRAYSYLYLNGAGLLFPVLCMPRKNCIQIHLSSSLLSSSLSLICSLSTPIIFKKPVIYYQFPTFFNPHFPLVSNSSLVRFLHFVYLF